MFCKQKFHVLVRELALSEIKEALEKKDDDAEVAAHMLQLVRAAFGPSRPTTGAGAGGSPTTNPRPSQPDPSIPPAPSRSGHGSPSGPHAGPSGDSCPSPGPPTEVPRFRERLLPLKAAAVELISIEELRAALDSRGVNCEHYFTPSRERSSWNCSSARHA
jgi:hypothetical protein